MKHELLDGHVEILSGFAFKSELFNTDGDGLPLIRIRDVVPGKTSTFYSGAFDEQFIAKDGDILIGMDGEFNCALWRGGHALINQRVCRVTPRSRKLDSGYLFRFLPDALKSIEERTPFATVKHLSAKEIRNISIPLPPLDEQRRIAAILDQADDLRRKRREALGRIDSFTQSVFLTMFGDWSSPGFNGKLEPVGAKLDFLTSGSRGWAEYYRESGDLFLRIQNVRHDELDLDDVAYVEPPQTAEAKRTRVEAGDVLLSITADLGRTAVVPKGIGSAFINQHLAILRTSAYEPRYLSAAIASRAGQAAIQRKNREGVKAGLNFDDVRSLEIPAASRTEQQKFAAIVAEIDKLKAHHRAHLARLDALFASLQHRAFRGDLSVPPFSRAQEKVASP